MAPLNGHLRLALLVAANLLLPLACLLFARGFFPYKPLLPGLASFEAQEGAEELELLSAWEKGERVPLPRAGRRFGKVVFMVVDALRSDFVFSDRSAFHFTQSLIRSGAALPFTAHAAPPTVTMPRVKALTTGSVPSFVDLILNFAESDTSSSLASQDTWLAQIKHHLNGANGTRGRLNFYGDDTWLKLFPDFFDAHDGTSSFFVSDFTEVDNNVTRHLPSTLASDEWDGLIMHYLGLDHIGHKTGPEGPNMPGKQREMDGVIQQIYEAVETQPHLHDTLLVVAGDHGMNSAGNHGGSAAGETSTALLLVSPKLQGRANATRLSSPAQPSDGTEFDYYAKVRQSDLVPSLSALLGIPFPKNNLGVVIPEVLQLWAGENTTAGSDASLQVLYRNALQVLDVVREHYGEKGFVNMAGVSMKFKKCRSGLTGVVQLRCLWSRAQRMLLAARADGRFSTAELAEALLDFLRYATDEMSATASSYDVFSLVYGFLATTLAVIAAVLSSPVATRLNTPMCFFWTLTALYMVMMFATSFVEEEQHIWYWMTAAWLAALACSKAVRGKPASLVSSATSFVGKLPKQTSSVDFATIRKHLVSIWGSLAPLVLHRLAMSWNQTGQKFAGEPDITKTVFPSYPLALWVLVAATYAHYARSMTERTFAGIFPWPMALLQSIAVAALALMFKINFTHADAPELSITPLEPLRTLTAGLPLVDQAQMTFALLGGIAIIAVVGHHIPLPHAGPPARLPPPTLPQRLSPILAFVLLTQSRATNAPLFLLYAEQATHLAVLIPSLDPRAVVPGIALTTLLCTYTSFFHAGGSNAISSIDLSNAYNGVASYNVGAVGALLFVANWAGPIWWAGTGAELLLAHRDRVGAVRDVEGSVREALAAFGGGAVVRRADGKRIPGAGTAEEMREEEEDSPLFTHAALLTLFAAAGLAATMAACAALRTHLFIWTVFSPKFLYAVAWGVGWHLVVGLGWGGVLWVLG